MSEDLWFIKTNALLHDPPHKPLALGRGHERQGKALAFALTGRDANGKVWDAIKQADWIASGADRESWLKDLRVDPRTELTLVHPMDGRPVLVAKDGGAEEVELAFPPDVVDRAEKLVEECGPRFAEIHDDRLRYLLLWRFAAGVLRAMEVGREGNLRLGALWELFPADTRMPDHPLWAHDSLVAALAPIVHAGQKAALLRMSVGPVQGFIEGARKLRDLWAGSSILADAIWWTMCPIVSRYGPDAVIFPCLRGEPRFDRWLYSEWRDAGKPGDATLRGVIDGARQHFGRALRVPSLPNVFTALVPLGVAADLAHEGEAAVRGWWRKQTCMAAGKAGDGAEYGERAARQADALLEVTWSVAPWPLALELDDALVGEEARGWHREEPHVCRVLEERAGLRQALGGYRPNGGLLYPDVFEQAVVLQGDAKRDRLISSGGEGGLKCSICGEREVLGPGDFWQQRATGLQQRGDRTSLGDGEQLCGPCTWKRHYPLRGGEDAIAKFGRRHPSTGEIAAGDFKLAVIRRCRQGDGELQKAVEDFVGAADAVPEEIEVHCAQAIDLEAHGGDEILQRFAHIDGEWMLPFPREDVSEESHAVVLAKARVLRRCACKGGRNIAAPRPYLAVVLFDGDEMGKWVSGTHHALPNIWDVLHPRARAQVEADARGADSVAVLKKCRRFLAPAFHGALSSAAATFARITAPMTIEGEGLPGHLVYAGGDDALFLAPLPTAVELVWRLRRRFSGWPWPFTAGNGGVPALISPWVAADLSATGVPRPAVGPRVDRLGLAFGGAATASAGLCVFHFQWPLGAALETAREAERAAKNAGRNALGITVQRRSGQITRAVVPFGEVSEDVGGDGARRWNLDGAPIVKFCDLVDQLARGAVSPRLASLFRAEVESLRLAAGADGHEVTDLWEMARALCERTLARRDFEVAKEVRDVVRDDVFALGEAVRERAGGAAAAIGDWAETLTAAVFLARGCDRG